MNKVLALDSPGGLVVEAFAMVEAMVRERVSSMVRPGAHCASACAQILLLSGVHRTVESSGRLGLHACRVAGERTRSTVCNEQNARARGTPYEAITAYLYLNDPAQMRWLTGPEAEHWGFTRRPRADARSLKPIPYVRQGDGSPRSILQAASARPATRSSRRSRMMSMGCRRSTTSEATLRRWE